MVKLVFGLSQPWLGYFVAWSLFGLSHSVDESFRGTIMKKAYFLKEFLEWSYIEVLGIQVHNTFTNNPHV